jgi:hypothetical protein
MFKNVASALVLVLLMAAMSAGSEKPVEVTYNKVWWEVTKRAAENTIKSVKVEVDVNACRQSIKDAASNVVESTKKAIDKVKTKIEIAKNNTESSI